MTLFWGVTGAMALAVAALLALAVLRGRRDDAPAQASDLRVYRDQLAEIDRDLARGTIPADEAERLRTEVSRRILAADSAARTDTAGPEQPRTASRAVAALTVALVVIGGFALYTRLGAPGYPDLPRQSRIAAAEDARQTRPTQAEAEAGLPATQAPDIDPAYLELVQKLRGAVAERPGDIEGLTLLARSEAALGNFVAAYEAQQAIIEAKGDAATARDYADLADMMILAAGGYVSPQAEAALDAALTRDPTNGVARYYAGLMMAQTGRPDIAFNAWDRLLRESPPDAPWLPPLRAQIKDLAWRAGVSDYTLPEPQDPAATPPGPAPGPTAEDMESAAQMTPEQRMEMIRGMVSGLSDRLSTQGGPPEEWARLITALGVLGETDRARAIWTEAQTAFAGSQEALDTLAAAAARVGIDQ
ncbi:c-type cytochrome biogenesis protein CcmI [Citreimonas salinaria]|uniref:Cytochrome c-type biogenesis protein CcmH n=1 Tax=Citreimonas salinaria TaxID=321339 RepID=A0A1H3H4Y3_9RHOB|nr:c-type cytochrome biogenesis protein CcmI [Citreimonas salinaria]SDY09709.1 cytochrome c-type biogenesis protein CcmH [Citreimonas salinaria]